jgi:hypothetical protein
MARSVKLWPDPYTTTLRRICLAQALVCFAALISTAVLLSHIVAVMNGSHQGRPVLVAGLNEPCCMDEQSNEKPDLQQICASWSGLTVSRR